MPSTRHKVIFPSVNGRLKASHYPSPIRRPTSRMHTSSLDQGTLAESRAASSTIPQTFAQSPALANGLITKTSIAQNETVKECLPYLKGIEDPANDLFDYNEHGVRRLDREEHVDFLTSHLSDYPAGYVGYDASRPWIMYWGLMGLYLLGKDITSYRNR